jgi:hypothetical protein
LGSEFTRERFGCLLSVVLYDRLPDFSGLTFWQRSAVPPAVFRSDDEFIAEYTADQTDSGDVAARDEAMI